MKKCPKCNEIYTDFAGVYPDTCPKCKIDLDTGLKIEGELKQPEAGVRVKSKRPETEEEKKGIELSVGQYRKSLGINFGLYLLSFVLLFIGFRIKGPIGMLIFVIWFAIAIWFGMIRMVSIHKKLAVLLKEYDIITMRPIFYGLLYFVAVGFLNLFGFIIYIIIVNSHIRKLEGISKINE